jgi:hypothetical protein
MNCYGCNVCATVALHQPVRRPWHLGCNSLHRRHFLKAVARCVLLVVVVVIICCAAFASSTVSSTRIDLPARAVAAAAADAPGQRRAVPNAVDGAVDLYGNEVNDAIATYSLDPGGSLYEVHSPQTELPRLGSPKS